MVLRTAEVVLSKESAWCELADPRKTLATGHHSDSEARPHLASSTLADHTTSSLGSWLLFLRSSHIRTQETLAFITWSPWAYSSTGAPPWQSRVRPADEGRRGAGRRATPLETRGSNRAPAPFLRRRNHGSEAFRGENLPEPATFQHLTIASGVRLKACNHDLEEGGGQSSRRPTLVWAEFRLSQLQAARPASNVALPQAPSAKASHVRIGSSTNVMVIGDAVSSSPQAIARRAASSGLFLRTRCEAAWKLIVSHNPSTAVHCGKKSFVESNFAVFHGGCRCQVVAFFQQCSHAFGAVAGIGTRIRLSKAVVRDPT